MAGGGGRGAARLEMLVAFAVVTLVLLGTVIAPSLGIQTALTGLTILLNLRRPGA